LTTSRRWIRLSAPVRIQPPMMPVAIMKSQRHPRPRSPP
jgi:hypothetical protein